MRRGTSTSGSARRGKIDAWFEAKTKGLNDWQKAASCEQWGTMQKVLSSRSRMERVVEDIVFDFSVKPRLASERGNAMLVASSIYEAAKYFELVPENAVQGQVRGGHLLQPAGAGRDAGGNRREHRNRQSSSSTTPTPNC
jgi:hypothetical protein